MRMSQIVALWTVAAIAVAALCAPAWAQEATTQKAPTVRGTDEVVTPAPIAPTTSGSPARTSTTATTTSGPSGGGGGGGLFGLGQQGFIYIMLAVLVLMWVWMGRGKKKEQKKRQEMLGNLKKGDRITTIGGIVGSVIEVKPDEVVVKVDETNNTRMRFARWAIRGIG